MNTFISILDIIQNIEIKRYLIFHCHVISKRVRITEYLLYMFDAVHVNLYSTFSIFSPLSYYIELFNQYSIQSVLHKLPHKLY